MRGRGLQGGRYCGDTGADELAAGQPVDLGVLVAGATATTNGSAASSPEPTSPDGPAAPAPGQRFAAILLESIDDFAIYSGRGQFKHGLSRLGVAGPRLPGGSSEPIPIVWPSQLTSRNRLSSG